MTLTLFNNPDDLNVVNKNLTQVSQMDVQFKESSSIINPELLIYGTLPTTFNYFYLPEFQRYYYVTDKFVDLNLIIHLIGHVDVLYTYRAKISEMTGVASRSESIYNKYLNDPLMNSLCYDRMQLMKIGQMNSDTQENYNYILAVAGNSTLYEGGGGGHDF